MARRATPEPTTQADPGAWDVSVEQTHACVEGCVRVPRSVQAARHHSDGRGHEGSDGKAQVASAAARNRTDDRRTGHILARPAGSGLIRTC